MGLDMYLTKEHYIGAKYAHNKVSGEIKLFKDGVEIPVNLNRVETITEDICYWRKANQIHNYFIVNHANNEDNCKPINLDIKDLQKLLDICKQVQSNKELASELLPVKNGFFFGSYEYDEYYFEYIDYTIEKLNEIIQEHSTDCEYYYRASW